MAVVIALAFKDVIDAVVDILTNLLAIPGTRDFSKLSFEIGGGVFRYGVLMNAVIGILTVAAVVFVVIVRPLNKLAERRKAGAEPEPVARSEDVLLLEEIRDLLAAQEAPARPRPRRPAPE